MRFLAVATALLVLVLSAVPAVAAPDLDVTSPFPAVSVEPGQRVTFDIEVTSSVSRRVDLEIVEVPDAWQATLRGGGFVVQGVHAGPDDPASIDLQVTVPPDAGRGTHRITLRATADGEVDTLDLDLTVEEAVAGAVTLETDFSRLEGSPDDTFRFDLTLQNNTPDETTFSLEAGGPEGWQVRARPSAEQRASTVIVEGGGSTGIQVEATPPPDVQAGEYPLGVRASGGGQTVDANLIVVITGTFEMTLTTPPERLNADGVSGRASRVALVIRNEGSAPLNGVSLSSSPPRDWTVTFEPETVESIPPGESAEVTAVVTPSREAIAGDYVLTLTARTDQATSNADIRFTVETSALWGGVGLLVILAAIGGLGLVFRRYGRR